MLPSVIHEEHARLFNFYYNGAVHQGMSYKSKLYKLVRIQDASHRLQAYCLACGIVRKGITAIVTASMQGYKVWVEVSAPMAAEGNFLPNCVCEKGVFPSCRLMNYVDAI